MKKVFVSIENVSKAVFAVLSMAILVLLCIVANAKAASVEELATVKLDFKQFAMDAANQSWWGDLRPAANSYTNFIGSKDGKDYMPAEARQAYTDMCTYTKNTYGWYIDEPVSCFTNSYYLKQLFINFDPTVTWGVSYNAYYENMPERNQLVFCFDVPQAGWYRMDISAFHEGTTGVINTTPATGVYSGSGYGDIYVNGELIYNEYQFAGTGKTIENGLGAVYLEEGENTVGISLVKDHNGGYESGRRSINLCSIEFVLLGDLFVETAADAQVDLTTSYLPFDYVLSADTHCVTTANANVAKAEINSDGKFVVSGIKAGKTELTLQEGGTALCTIPVSVVNSISELEELTRFIYTLNGSETATSNYGDVAFGSLTALSNLQNEYDIGTIRRVGDVYFASDHPAVAKVEQENGDVFCVGEGKAKITAYIQIDGVIIKDQVTLTVTDDTTLETMELGAVTDYVGVGNALQLTLSGTKTSGCPADMSKYAVSYSVDDQTIAAIDAHGRLTGIKAGTVTVTATTVAAGTTVSDTMKVDVVANKELPGSNVFLDFTDGRAVAMQTATLEDNGAQINRDLTVSGGATLDYSTKHGFLLSSAKIGDCLAIDFVVSKDGWYTIETWGSLFSYGGIADVYVDDCYVGEMDFDQDKGSTYTGNSLMNTIYLEAGVHTCILECTKRGSFFLGKIICRSTTDPNEMNIEILTKDELLVGESVQLSLDIEKQNNRGTFTLKNVAASSKPDYTNYYRVTSSNSGVVSVSDSTLTAVAKGTAVITVSGEINHESFSKSVSVSVMNGSVASVALDADETTLKPTASGTNLVLTAYNTGGAQINMPSGVYVSYSSSDTSVAKVSSAGKVTLTGKEGSALITALVNENGREMTAQVWITVTKGKTEPTLFTYEERSNAQKNAKTYSWAINEKNAAVRKADAVIANLDTYYENMIPHMFPRRTRVGTKTDPEAYYCRYCKMDLSTKYSVYPWIVDPIANPWKITCPNCKRDFPSNDFESYYLSGLGEDGRFYPEKANKKYLVNELYPEMGEGWGVDDGFGYVTGRTYSNGAQEVHTYIGYYMHCVFDSLSATYNKNDITEAITALQNAYLYTGDEKYGSAGAILIDRMADIYPEYDYYTSDSRYGGFDKGKIVNAIWEAVTIGQCLAQAADAFWPAMDNEDVIEYLRDRAAWKGVSADEITPEYIRNNVDQGILLEIRDACYEAKNYGNFGMHQASMAYAAVALDRLPETREMIDWIFRYGESITINSRDLYMSGGGVLSRLITDVDRDGIGNEGSNMYNPMWFQNLMEVANALSGYDRIEGVDLWENPKFITMFNALNREVLCGTAMATTGEAGYVQGYGMYTDVSSMVVAFSKTGDRELARGLYFSNNNSVSNIHGSIFDADPEAGLRDAILQIVEEDGEWNWNRSEMLCGEGIAFLRNGPEKLQKGVNNDQFSDYWMFFGIGGGAHGACEALNIGVEAFGVIASPTLGYPKVVSTSDPERMQWMLNTVSHNTVVVNDKCQQRIPVNSFPLHFDDAGQVKLMDAEAPGAYNEADIYRRTLVSIEAEENVYYAVDFFRVLGGSEHVYSFHAACTIEPRTEGLQFAHQPMGTYAGPEIPLGNWVSNPYTNDAAANTGSGYSWLDNVYRDNDPDTTFAVDFAVEDFGNKVINSDGVRMRLTMLSEEPVTEVAVADGHPTQNGRNPEILKYLLVRRSGDVGMDSLFTSVIEPYRGSRYISSMELLEVKPYDPASGDPADRAAAIKVELTSGRVDYIMYASNPDAVYCVYEDGVEVLRYRGFMTVCSYLDGKINYAYGCETMFLGEGAGTKYITGAQQRVTGVVKDFTLGLADRYTMTVQMDTPVSADTLTGRYIYVENDGMENGAYQIYGAQVDGNTAVLDLHTQTLTRDYVDPSNLSAGYVYNIAVGQSYSIPLSTEAECLHPKNRVSYTSSGDGTHMVIKTCTACLAVTSETSAACKDGSDTNTLCDKCGYDMSSAAEKINIVGTNMTLGNDLKINFLIKKSDIRDGFTAKVSQAGSEPVEVELFSYNNTYYAAAYSVAAKEMTDVLSIEVFDASGNLVSEPFTRTIKQYAMTLFANSTNNELKSVIVDMLNYGTEAQKYFGHNEDAYANADITQEQQETYATGDVECVNNQISGANFVGANLSLEDSILLNVFFKGISGGDVTGITATVSYEDYQGKEVIADAVVSNQGNSMIKVIVNQIVLADAKCPVTVIVYQDGAELGIGVESVESYIARNLNNASTGAINMAIMKFAASAKNYLT